MKKRLLITGSNGFIGSFLTEKATDENFEVFAGIRKGSNLQNISNLSVSFFVMDFSDKDILKQQLLTTAPFDYIIHNAGITKACKNDMFEKIIFQNTKNFVDALYETNRLPEKFIYISSLAAIGPGDEKTLKPVSENDKPHPVTFYGQYKLKAENYIKSKKDLPWLIFRPTGTYGPREQDFYTVYKTLKHGLETYIGSTKQHLSFVYVEDLANVIVNSLKTDVVHKSYFVSDLKQYTAGEFNTLIKHILNKKTVKIVFPKYLIKVLANVLEKISCFTKGQPYVLNREKYKEVICKNWLCDSSPLVTDLGFKPEYDLETGLRKTLQWYQNKNLL